MLGAELSPEPVLDVLVDVVLGDDGADSPSKEGGPLDALRDLDSEKIDGVDVGQSTLLETFRQAGYAPDYRGLIDIRPPGSASGDARA